MRSPRKKNVLLREELRLQRQVIFSNYRYWFHIVIWSAVILYCGIFYGAGNNDFNTGVRLSTDGQFSVLSMPMTMAGIVIGSIMAACMVYFFLLLAIPYARYKKKKRFLLIGVGINGILWIGVLLITGLIAGYMDGHGESGNKTQVLFTAYVVIFSMMLSAYFFAIYYFVDLYDQQKMLTRFQQVFTEKLQAETNFLKTQINPHFLFNTLNNIYSLTLSKSDDAPRITRQLKALISYMVNDCAQDLVRLDGEVAFLQNYIALEQLRNNDAQATIDLKIDGALNDLQIAPLLLINFIENAFKHGVKAGIQQAYVAVKLQVADEKLMMEVVNSKPVDAAVQESIKTGSGIGIQNVKRRLALLYPGRHRLRIRETASTYKVSLTVNL